MEKMEKMDFHVVYFTPRLTSGFKSTSGKLVVKDTFSSEQNAKDNLSTVALAFIKEAEGDSQVAVSMQDSKSVDEIKGDTTLKDGHYLKHDDNDGDVLHLYQKESIVYEGTLYNTYDIKMTQKGYYSVATIGINVGKMVEEDPENINDMVRQIIGKKIESNDYTSLVEFLTLYNDGTSDEVDTGVDQFLTDIVTKRIESGKNGLVLGLLSLIRKHIDYQTLREELGMVPKKKDENSAQVKQENSSFSYNSVVDDIKDGNFKLKPVQKHQALAPPVPPRPVGGFKYDEKEDYDEEEYEEEEYDSEEEDDEEYEDEGVHFDEPSDMEIERDLEYDEYTEKCYDEQLNKYYDVYYDQYYNEKNDENDLNVEDFESISNNDASEKSDNETTEELSNFKEELVKQIGKLTHNQTPK